MTEGQFLLELKDISKEFPGVKALNKVNLNLKRGEIHSVIGENGAGKSTLMNIISGIITPDEGEIFIESLKIDKNSYNPIAANKMKIAQVHQELSLCPNMTIAENIFFNSAPVSNTGMIMFSELYRNTEELCSLFNISHSPRTKVSNLNFGGRQQIEILKSIAQQAKIIIFDEPTTGISKREIKLLFNLIEQLKNKGLGLIYISHKLEEVLSISDRITVLRDGKKVDTMQNININKDKLISLMVGRKVEEIYHHKEETSIEKNRVIFQVKNLFKENLLDKISFNLREGEIIGVAGLVGAGRSELCDTLFGIIKKDRGVIKIENTPVNITSPWNAVKHNMGYIPEDRKLQGLFLEMSIRENIISSKLKKYTKKTGVMDHKKEKLVTIEYCEKLSIITNNIEKYVKELSGGNQQKVLLAKWLNINPKILIIDEPTKGVDVGAKAEIHRMIKEAAKIGIGIIMVSSELPEILNIADRVLIMSEGTILKEMGITEASQESIMQIILNYKQEGSTITL